MPNIGPLEIGIVLVIALIVFGPKKLPDLGRSLGSSIREFKGSIGVGGDDEKDEKPAVTPVAVTPAAPVAEKSVENSA
jgi:sec-independent protein translocase protein TatA